YIHNYLDLLGISIFYYDYAITFGDEYMRIWTQPTWKLNIWFLINRYLTFFGDIAVNVGNFYGFKSAKVLFSPLITLYNSCSDYALYRQSLLIGAQVVVCIILCLRTYALYNRSKRILAYVIGSGFILGGLAIFAVTDQKQGISQTGGCHIASTRLTYVRIAVAWEALFVYDISIFVLTLYKTWKERHVMRTVQDNIFQLIWRDGAIYFAVMASVNLANLLTFYPLLEGVLSTSASSVSVTMMSRLMLNLHESVTPNNSVATGPNLEADDSTTLQFSTTIAISPGAIARDMGLESDEEAADIPDGYELRDVDDRQRRTEESTLWSIA
ncbi:hypothetical protein WOLCODRAFT_77655, partial [Wolfiporia cocos MD-104 SS10]